MKDSLLTDKNKAEIISAIKKGNIRKVILILEKFKTDHAGTAKTKDKRFVVKEIVRCIDADSKSPVKDFFITGNALCNMEEPAAREIGVSIIYRGYKYSPAKVKEQLLKIADDPNWEVREYAGNSFAAVLKENKDQFGEMLNWTKHPSENVRRAVIFSAIGLRNEADIKKAFKIFESLMYDDSLYVKKNLGPFILGCYFGNAFPIQVLKQLKRWSKIKDEHVRWNIIMSFNNSFGNKYPDEALDVISLLLDDENKTVRRAVRSTLNQLSKRHKIKVTEFREKYKLT